MLVPAAAPPPAYTAAAAALALRRAALPAEGEDALWPEADLGILSDLGLPADELEVLVGELELYPDEQLATIARRCGFADALAEVVGGR